MNLIKQFWNSYNEAALELYPQKSINSCFTNPITQFLYSSSLNVLEIGAGQSNFIIDMIDKDYYFTVYDVDPVNNKFLLERIKQINIEYLNRIEFHDERFPDAKIDYSRFQLMIFCNVLHFIPPDILKSAIHIITQQSKPGTIIYFRTHSIKQSAPTADFPSMLSQEEIITLFPKDIYMYHLLKESKNSNNEIEDRCTIKALRSVAQLNNWNENDFVKLNRKATLSAIDWEVIVEKI